MNKWIYRFCFFIILIFALIGATFVSIIIHELSHKQDLQSYVNNDSELCFFAFPGNATLKELVVGNYAAGYFAYHYNDNVTQNTKNNINSFTEAKALFMGIIIMVILTVCVMVEMIRRINNKEAEEFYTFFKRWKREANLSE